MAIVQAVCLTFKEDLWNGVHEPGDAYKIALYVAATASLDKNTAAYTTTGEVVGTGYTAGGLALANRVVGASGDVRYLMWDDPVWAAATILADGALIYNSTQSNKALCTLLFTNAPVSSTNGNFTVDFPAAGVSALLRIP